MQAYAFPQALTNAGAFGEEGHPSTGLPFYRLTGATVRQGVSAFMVVTVFGKTAPAVGVKVINLFPDGNGEVIQTDGSGVVRFQFAASSAFTNPGTGPFTVFIADDGAFKDFDASPKRVAFSHKLSDIVHSLGDFRGEHTEIYLQFVEQDDSAPAPTPDPTPTPTPQPTPTPPPLPADLLRKGDLDGLINAFEQVVAELKKLRG
ncbi:MAG: hypothetical protein HZB53_03260 [Chloroflexi bacterium]|nr:hypothetical protein [Chloroflexota bacterium]